MPSWYSNYSAFKTECLVMPRRAPKGGRGKQTVSVCALLMVRGARRWGAPRAILRPGTGLTGIAGIAGITCITSAPSRPRRVHPRAGPRRSA